MTSVSPFPGSVPVRTSRGDHRTDGVERSCQKCTGSPEERALKKLVVKALWTEFPGHQSEKGLAEEACHFFRDKKGDPISPRTVRYWLREETLPSAVHLSALVIMQPAMFLGHWLGRGDK